VQDSVYQKPYPVQRHSLTWVVRGRAAGQGMVFDPRCPKQGIQFDMPLP